MQEKKTYMGNGSGFFVTRAKVEKVSGFFEVVAPCQGLILDLNVDNNLIISKERHTLTILKNMSATSVRKMNELIKKANELNDKERGK